jgi:nucleoside-diphosphate-sugar epimerase
MRIFLAGASGALGRRLVPLLKAHGHTVVGTTRSPDKVALLRELGAEPVVVNALDATAIGEEVAREEADVIVHQLTALSNFADLRKFDEAFAPTNRLRTEGTDNLIAAARAAAVERSIAQSYVG